MLNKIVAALMLSAASAANAGVIFGASTMINGAGLTELEGWMGGGTLTLTNIFTKAPGNNSPGAFHAAVDGKGATITVMRASEDNGATWKTIGGYNPLSWNNYSEYVKVADPAQWTAFIFNLTDHVVREQTQWVQTRNRSNYGPTFGVGNDIIVAGGDLSFGSSRGYSYGAGCNNSGGNCGSDYLKSIVDNSVYNGDNMLVGALEVFAVNYSDQAPAQVPEPGALMLTGLGLFGMATLRRRKAAP